MKDNKIEFLYQSITDTQATIRALDVKLGFFFVIIFLPLAAMKEITATYQTLASINNFFIITNLVAITWLASFITLFLAAISKDNPSKTLNANFSNGNKNAFYNGDVIYTNLTTLIPYIKVKQKASFTDKLKGLPDSEDALIETLTFESMKLVKWSSKTVHLYRCLN